jgi:hypothetical protein
LSTAHLLFINGCERLATFYNATLVKQVEDINTALDREFLKAKEAIKAVLNDWHQHVLAAVSSCQQRDATAQ